MAVLGFEAHSWTEGLLLGHLVAWISAAYCYWIVTKLPLGVPRLLSCLPVLVAYAYVPFLFNHETHLVGVASFYCILTWIASFKLLLLCYNTGPGCDPWVASTFPRFAIVMTYPAHVKRPGKVVKRAPGKGSSWIDQVSLSEAWYMLVARSVVKLIVLMMLLQLLSWRTSLPMILIHLLLSVQLYLFATIVLEVLAAVASLMFEVVMEPHFDNPFAAVSLGEFWGRRWNLLVSNCLRETVYTPVLYLMKSAKGEGKGEEVRVWGSELKGVRGFDWRKLVAGLVAFLVSGLCHELLVYYVTLEVTWEMMSFFVVQGIAVTLEAIWKLYCPNTRPPRVVSKVLTLGFAFITAHWLFWPPVDAVAEQVATEMQKMLAYREI